MNFRYRTNIKHCRQGFMVSQGADLSIQSMIRYLPCFPKFF